MTGASEIVVGVDGSNDSLAAIDWAAADAARRHRPLRIVHAFLWPVAHAPAALPTDALEDSLRRAARDVLTEAVQRARDIAADLRIEVDMPVQQATAALLAASRNGAVVVVGNRGLGGFTGLLVGSTGVQLAAHATGPVVIVRRAGRPAGPQAGRVVVGVEGSHAADAVLRFAFEQASLRGIGLTATHIYRWPPPGDPGVPLPVLYDPGVLREEERRVLAESIAGWSEKYPEVDVRATVTRGRAGAGLVEAAGGAELLVVGSRGRGGFSGLLLGSVSQAAVHHAPCPVAVVKQ